MIKSIKTCHPEITECTALDNTIIMQVGYCAIIIEFSDNLPKSIVEDLNFCLNTTDNTSNISIIKRDLPSKEDFETYIKAY